jgi:hypothetical protein
VLRKKSHYRWFRIALFLGAGLALLMLVNSIRNYVVISRRFLIDQVHRDLSVLAANVGDSVRSEHIDDTATLRAFIDNVYQQNKKRIVWVHVRDGKGDIVAQAGSDTASPITSPFVRDQLRNGDRVSRVITISAGDVLAAVFPLRGTAGSKLAARDRPLLLEIASFLDGSSGNYWPLQRNLLIDSSVAVVLLVALTLLALRFRAYVDGRHLERQVDIARRVQSQLLPPPYQTIAGHFEIAGYCEPALHVGGDFCDAFQTADNNFAFVLGDVCGKGIPAALLMGVVHGAVRSASWTNSPLHHEAATKSINRLLCERASQDRFVSMFWAYFDSETDHLHYINAGHFPPLLVGASGDIVPLTGGGPVLGMLRDARYTQGAIPLDPGDLLLLYSDGILEASNAAGEEFGEERLIQIAEAAHDDEAEKIRDRILGRVRTFTGTRAPEDDRTLLVVRYRSPAVSSRSDAIERCVGADAA